MNKSLTIDTLIDYYYDYWQLYYAGNLLITVNSNDISFYVDSRLVLVSRYSSKEIQPPTSFSWKKILLITDDCCDALSDYLVYTSSFEPRCLKISSENCIKLDFNFLEAVVLPLFLYQETTTNISSFDKHSRFSPKSLPSSEQNYLHRPTVDLLNDFVFSEYLKTELRESKTKVHLSHDVDRPLLFCTSSGKLSFMSLLRSLKCKPISSFVFYVRLFTSAFLNNFSLEQAFKKNFHFDPYWNFDTLINLAVNNNIRPIFYLLRKTNLLIDSDYTCFTPIIADLIADINRSGCLIGTHLSYNAPYNRQLTLFECSELRATLHSHSFSNYQQIYNRNHYLRFSPLHTPSIMSSANIYVDSTVGFAQMSGFRAGTVRPFYLFDYSTNSTSSVLEFPLCVMDNTLFGKNSHNCDDDDEAMKLIEHFVFESKLIKGSIFSILFHNSSLTASHKLQLKVYHRFLELFSSDTDLISI